MTTRDALLACLFLGSMACASTVTATRQRGDDASVDAPVDVPVDPLDDPTARIDCPPGIADPCGPGRHCIAVGPGFAGICVRDGSRGGLCREDTLACDESIPCVEMWCERGNHFAPRTSCGERLCGLNEGCVELDGRLRCLPFGSPGGYCRQAGGPECDEGLRCDLAALNRRRCGRPLRVGEACATHGRTSNFCAGDTTCVGPGDTGTCQTIGGEGARCRVDGTCDPGLECQLPFEGTQLTCLRPIPEGRPCGFMVGSAHCVTGTSCSETLRVCVRDGTFLGACRSDAPRCDRPLRCHRDTPVCVTTLNPGALCSSGVGDADCVEGSSCVVVSATFEGVIQRCVADGVAGGRCRQSKEPCDDGLMCGRGLICAAP